MSPNALQIVLTKKPTGPIVADEHFAAEAVPLPQASDLKENELLVETLYLSFDPIARAWLAGGSYITVLPGQKMAGLALVRVLASRTPGVEAGDFGSAWSGWATQTTVEAQYFTKIHILEGTKLVDYVSYLGLTGMTGYFGMTRIAKPEKGNTVVVSTAAGATGSIAAQVAKILGAGKVVGITGDDDKVKWLKELGLDEALNYRDPNFEDNFAKAVPDGIDVFFDNVGGRQLELALKHINKFGRITICGDISSYNNPNPHGINNHFQLALRSATMQGVNIYDYVPELEAGQKAMDVWAKQGKIKATETIYKGPLEDAPQVLVDLFQGKNTGKMLLEIKNPDA